MSSTSSDYGETFSTEIRVNAADEDIITASFAKIAADNTGHVTVGWSDSRNALPAADSFVNTSSDFGETFLPNDIQVNQTLGTVGAFQGIFAGCQGRVYALWTDIRDGWVHLFLNHSFDHGLTWEPQDVTLNFQNRPVQDLSFTATRNGHRAGHGDHCGRRATDNRVRNSIRQRGILRRCRRVDRARVRTGDCCVDCCVLRPTDSINRADSSGRTIALDSTRNLWNQRIKAGPGSEGERTNTHKARNVHQHRDNHSADRGHRADLCCLAATGRAR